MDISYANLKSSVGLKIIYLLFLGSNKIIWEKYHTDISCLASDERGAKITHLS